MHTIKTESEFDPTNSTLIFPKHYKQRNKLKQSATIIPNNDTLNVETITKVVCEEFNGAADLLFRFNIKKFLYEKNIKDIKQVSNYMCNILSKRINIQDYSDLNEEDERSDSNNSSNMLHWVQK